VAKALRNTERLKYTGVTQILDGRTYVVTNGLWHRKPIGPGEGARANAKQTRLLDARLLLMAPSPPMPRTLCRAADCLHEPATRGAVFCRMHAPSQSVETVDHPPHYGGAHDPFEVIKVLEAWQTIEEHRGFLEGNVIKYLARASKKNGDEDRRKAAWYADRLKQFIKKQAKT